LIANFNISQGDSAGRCLQYGGRWLSGIFGVGGTVDELCLSQQRRLSKSGAAAMSATIRRAGWIAMLALPPRLSSDQRHRQWRGVAT
jgi:hypothetical protein